MSTTTNKSNRDVSTSFNKNADKINTGFEKKDIEDLAKKRVDKDLNKIKDDKPEYRLPHQLSIGEIIVNMRDLFFQVMELLIDRKNPIPFIFASETRQFSFAILLVLIGTILLLFSNLMISNKQ